MLKRASIISLLVSSCVAGEDIPGYDTVLHCEIQDCSNVPVERVSALMDNYVLRYETLLDYTPEMPKHIYIQEHFWYMWDFQSGENAYYQGNAHTDEVYVVGIERNTADDLDSDDEIGAPLELWELPLPHEFNHNALRAYTGDGDHNHIKPGGPWEEAHDLIVETMYKADIY